MKRSSAILACLLFSTHPLRAQQVVPPGQLTLAGFPVYCGNIPTAIQPINDIAYATPGWIILHPDLFQLPPVVQIFIYAHECGHHAVAGTNDAAADCFAIRLGRDQGWFREQDIAWLQVFFGQGTGDYSHAPGPIRIQNMMSCFYS
jgi:hypothetical protein